MDVIENFRRITRARGFEPDHSQLEALGRLQHCYEGWRAYEAHRNPVTRFLVHPAPPKGLYLWGGVGRGKTLLMDCFYAVVPARKKCRLHFHEFMHDVHRSLEDLRGQADPLDALARELSSSRELICLDEFHVSDIADAMVLSRLLPVLFACHVALVATSNFHPDQLYPDGLNRERFLPAIDLLKNRLDIVNVDGGMDYRERSMARVRTYLCPANADSEAELDESFEDDGLRYLLERDAARAGGLRGVMCGGLLNELKLGAVRLQVCREVHRCLSDAQRVILCCAGAP